MTTPSDGESRPSCLPTFRGVLASLFFGALEPKRAIAMTFVALVLATPLFGQLPTLRITRRTATKEAAGEWLQIKPEMRLLDEHLAPLPDRTIRAHLLSGDGTLYGDTAVTDSQGYAEFKQLSIIGRPGAKQLLFSYHEATDTTSLELVAGNPTRVTIVRQPSRNVVSDSSFRVQPIVRVADNADNPIYKAVVSTQLCDGKIPRTDTTKAGRADSIPSSCSDETGRLIGTISVATNEDGLAEFNDLGIAGFAPTYKLLFTVTAATASNLFGRVPVLSDRIFNQPDVFYNKSYVVVSAIKSIAGKIPDNEFFDARFRFRMSVNWFLLANVDIALTNRGTDTVKSSQEALTEAAFSINHAIHTKKDTTTAVPERSIFVGPAFKIFNTLPYYGVHVGDVELGGSVFQGSSLAASFLHRINNATYFVGTDTLTAERWNILGEFFLRSSRIDFFKTLTIRGGFLIPLVPSGRVSSRITIAVPVGTLDLF